jgi:hypothetical protein
MTPLQKLSLAATLSFTAVSFAASISKTIQPDNVILCESNAACLTETVNGRSYKVLNTPRFTVMVSVSREGDYTRADISVTNKTDMPLNVTPDDFRVEVVTPKPKVLNYIPPANLNLPPAQPIATSAPHTPLPPVAAGFNAASGSAAPVVEVDDSASQQKSIQESAEKASRDHDLSATSIAPNEAMRGRVFFARDKHAHLVNVVLPIAGVVFEFPYAMKK